MAVFAFHDGISLISGGYVGVDIFFVISGYLITGIILSDVQSDRFSFWRFYERRVRRIVPALAVMLAGSGLLAMLLLLPVRLENFGISLIATAASVSNVFFWAKTGYFDTSTTSAPLLHTWSLGVEEQFYFLWPLLIALVHRFWPGRMVMAIVAVIIASFTLSAIGAANGESSAFYLLHSRAWELAIGAVLATGAIQLPAHPMFRETSALAGLLMIAWSCLAYDATTPFPGIAALLPCVGCGLIILAGMGGESLTARMLSFAPMVLIGRISYSLYLWHWPIIVFKNIADVSFSTSAKIDKVCVLLLGLGIAWLSWRFVERPFRAGALLPSRRAAFAGAGASMAAACIAGGGMLLSAGMPWRYQADIVATAAYLDYSDPYQFETSCFLQFTSTIGRFDRTACLKQDPSRRNFLLIGDSHAAHLRRGLTAAYPDINFQVAMATGCRPLVGSTGPRAKPVCIDLMNFIFSEYLPQARLDGVILSAAWKDFEMGQVGPTLDLFHQHGIPTIVLGPIMMYDKSLPELMVNGMLRNDPGYVARHRSGDQRRTDENLALVTAGHGATFISLQHLLCDSGSCPVHGDDGMPLQFDYGHLTAGGSISVARRLRAAEMIPE